MKNTLLYFFLLLFIQSCSQVSKTEMPCVEKVTLQLKRENRMMNLSEIVDSIAYIPLETTEKSLLGSIDRVIVTEAGEYLIADKETASALFLFTSEGKFIRQIGTKGAAPEEYVKIEDVAYCHRKAYIWDSASRKILEYSLDGELLNVYKFNYTAYYFSCIGDGKFAFFCDYARNQSLSHEGKLPNLLRYDVNSGEQKSDLFFDESIPSQAYVLSLNNLSENVLYTPMNDTIYEVSFDEVKRKYVLDYPEVYKKRRAEYFAQFGNRNMTSWNEEKNFPVLITCFTCEPMNVFFIRSGQYLHYAFYFPESGISKEASAMGNPIINDMDKAASFFLLYAKGNMLYSVLAPGVLIENNPDLAKRLNVKEDDNLLVVKMFVKRNA